jgi:hypothetical protein
MKRLKNVLAMLLCFAVVFSLFIFIPDIAQRAEAATSLPWIEEIKRSPGTFDILEIVPQAGSGSIGWYIGGQEPGANWAADRLSALPSKAQRVTAANAYLSSLQAAGLLGDADATPLKKTGDYLEYAPWERGNTADLRELPLREPETYTGVTGTFAETPSGGEYRADNSYALHPGQTPALPGGNYEQDISALSARPDDLGIGHYYITLGTFSPLSAFTVPADGLLIYRRVTFVDADLNGAIDELYDVAILPDGSFASAEDTAADTTGATVIYLNFHGLMGSTYMTGFNILAQYYTVPFTVSPDFNQYVPQFEATADAFVRVDDGRGHFDAVTSSFTYVGRGAAGADYSYSPDPSGSSYTVHTRAVFYTGGFTNNSWFLRYVFDWESGEPAPAFKVSSLTPGDVTEDAVEGADLIVLSEGRGTISTPYDAGNDIGAAVGDAILAAVAAEAPVIVANSLRSRVGLAIGSLAAELCAGGGAHYVSGSVYCHQTALAASAFHSPIEGDHTLSTDPFYPVWYELDYENFLRLQNDPGAVTLPETVSMATCVRYIINFGGQRVITNKTEIRVLELQPRTGSHLSTTTVSGWTGIAANRITIDTMSTAEFIGKIDDLVEKYDLVYVGADTGGFTVIGGKTSFTDTDMNGLLYMNIGDLYVSGYQLTGLLDRDYSTNASDRFNDATYGWLRKINNSNNTYRTFRMAGNDLTKSKVDELLDFAAAGYPIIVANALMGGTSAVDAYEFRAVLTGSDSGLRCEAQAVSGSIPAGTTMTYQWYKDGAPVGTGSNTYTLQRPEDTGTYSCSITIGGQTATSNTADVTVTVVPYSVTPDEPSSAIPGSFPAGNTRYTVTIGRTQITSTRYQYSISVSPGSYASISYQWQRRNGQSNNYSNINGATSSTYEATDDTRYRCVVTINGVNCTSQWINRTSYQDGNPNAQFDNIPNYTAFSADVTYSVTADGATLTAAWDPPVGTNRSIVWFRERPRDDEDVSHNYSITNPSGTMAPGRYYCRLRVRSGGRNYDAYSNTYTIVERQNIVNVTVNSGGSTATVPEVPATLAVSTATVDQCSQVYRFLDAVTGLANVFTEQGAPAKKSTIVQYLNLSKPKIELTESPVAYTGPGGPSLAGKTLRYTFTIRNETDVTPADTRYYCNLYMDMNADGRYKYPEEQLADVAITDSGGNVVRTGELKADVTYTATRTLPAEYVGIVPWKLEVVKVGQERVHASAHGYTHVAGTPTAIHILQVLPSDGGGLNLKTNATYQTLFGQVKNDFFIDITTIEADRLTQNMSGTVSLKDSAGAAVRTVSYSGVSHYLNTFDMLIIGFDDMWGDLNAAAANAVAAFIDNADGKSVLFTHDTTSFMNIPLSSYQATSGSVSTTNWGYYFNSLLRDAVGLDRYGVTNPMYGVTQHSPLKDKSLSQPFNVAAGALSLANAVTMENNGYSVAYAPKSRESADSKPVTALAETQGYTDFNLRRYRNNTDNSFADTTVVSQVNEGQITTYPFDLNLAGFGSGTSARPSTMNVATTHEQYYQLNMNPNEIVVWYCLTGSDFPIYNDVVNAYYIYSIGNVTYSGAGHSGGTVVESEAKLFVNTMIAAYRTAAVPPAVKFVDPVSRAEITNVFFVSDDNGTDGNSGDDSIVVSSRPEAASICFQIVDPSLGAKTVTASFSYMSDGHKYTPVLPIYIKGNTAPINVNSDGSAKSYSLSGDIVYYIKPTSEMLDRLASDGSLKLTLTVTSSLLPGQPNSAEVTLRKIGLFPLD